MYSDPADSGAGNHEPKTGMTVPDIQIFQIVYDEASRRAVMPGAVPLEAQGTSEGWFEFRPILKFLRDREMSDEAWIGFLSPRFTEKTGCSLDDVRALIAENPGAEVALFSPVWENLAVNWNVWSNADLSHPGLLQASQEFVHAIGRDIDLSDIVTDFDTSVFSNYVIARKRYWSAWIELAEAYADFVENDPRGAEHESPAPHRGHEGYRMKTFVQERLATLVLLHGRFRTIRPDYPDAGGPPLDPEPRKNRSLTAIAARCARAKTRYRKTGNPVWRALFRVQKARFHAARSDDRLIRWAFRAIARRF